ncbi:UNVERIFIED_CONTAM: hypothetical protein Sradi_6759400 [Sesamum radiatum]|uniref:Uncharacterized protein n=1 Tax=Sesamum radiatum TaxID=300843 RepID=A0AAW2JSH6_SESRA
MPPTYFPLRWESTGEQWWFASPIDWAAANGHYDLVKELLHIDSNLLLKLTSLPKSDGSKPCGTMKMGSSTM